MTSGMTLRPAEPHDAEALAAFVEQVPGAPHWPAYVYASLSCNPAKLVLVLEREEGLAGYVIAALIPPAPFEAELEAIGVAPRFQRLGHGGALLAAMLKWAAAQGADRVLLEVRASNLAAQQLYRAHGFVLCGRRSSYYTDPVEDAVLMERTGDCMPAPGDSSDSGKIDGDYGS